MPSALIFDLDGTLIDSLRGIADTLNRTLTAHGLPGHGDAQVRGFIGDGLQNLIRRALPAGTPEDRFESIYRLYRKDYELSWQQGSQPYPGIHAMLAAVSAAGIPMAVLSNKVHDFTTRMVATIFPESPFQMVLGQREGVPQKPDPHGALELAEAMQANPANCLFVGDSTVDFLTATNAGMQAICVDWGYHDRSALEAAGAERIASTPEELIKAIGL